MVKALLAKNQQKIRFLLVGAFNTAVDFGLLFFLTSLGLAKIPSNMIATGVAFCFSFIANRKFTFKSNGKLARQATLFVGVTLFGLWIIQPIIILITDSLLPVNGTYNLLIGKIIATIATLIWNYILYSKVVFKSSS